MHNIYYLGLSGEQSLPFGLLVMEHPYTQNLVCDVPFLLGSDFEVH